MIISEVEHLPLILSAINLHDRQMIPKLLPFPRNDVMTDVTVYLDESTRRNFLKVDDKVENIKTVTPCVLSDLCVFVET